LFFFILKFITFNENVSAETDSQHRLQGECRPGCENLRRDVTVNTNYGRVNGFLVYLYDGPRVPEFDRPGVANVDKIKGRVSVFLGIPYAQPPVGEARLMVRPIFCWVNLRHKPGPQKKRLQLKVKL
jgi:hypothetical protein